MSMEDRLDYELDDAYGHVDGHDFGSGEMDIFVHTSSPIDAFRSAEAVLGGVPGWTTVRAACRRLDGDGYTVIWPETLHDLSVS